MRFTPLMTQEMSIALAGLVVDAHGEMLAGRDHVAEMFGFDHPIL